MLKNVRNTGLQKPFGFGLRQMRPHQSESSFRLAPFFYFPPIFFVCMVSVTRVSTF